MINKINFTGREEMLVKIGKKAEKEADFFSESKIFTKEEWEKVDKFVKSKKNVEPAETSYSSPFASFEIKPKQNVESDAGYLYAIEHGTTEDVAKDTANRFIIEG